MAGKLKGAPFKPPKPPDPNKAVMAAPRMAPIKTRSYGKGNATLSSGPVSPPFGGGVGYGGPNPWRS